MGVFCPLGWLYVQGYSQRFSEDQSLEGDRGRDTRARVVGMKMLASMMRCCIVLGLFLAVLGVAGGYVTSQDLNVKSLRLVVEVCRHGDRSTLYTFPNDKLPFDQWPQGRGQLTPVGERAHYELGRKLRKRYIDTGFLSESYNSSQIHVRSTDIDRTLMSAMSQMAGFYPAGTASNYNVGEAFGMAPQDDEATGLPQRWQIIPIHTVSTTMDTLLLPGGNCPMHRVLMDRLRFKNEWKEKTKKSTKICEKVKKVMGTETCDLNTLNQVNDVFVCNDAHGIPVDPRITPDDREQIKEYADWLTGVPYENQVLKQMRGGAMLYEIGMRFMIAAGKEKPDVLNPSKPDLKFMLLSAHDTTVSALLGAMDLYDGINPPYNSTVIFELHEVEKQHFVQIMYNDEIVVIPGCDEVCKLERAVKLLSHTAVDPVKREKICSKPFPSSFMLLVLGTIVGVLIGALVGYISGKGRKTYVIPDSKQPLIS